MKNSFLYIAIFLFSASLYSAEPLVKFYLNDGSTKQYNLSEIDSLGVIDKKNNYVMRIHYDDTLIAYYPTEIIGSIKFENDSLKRMMLNVYIFSYPKPYKISSIDSITFYIDQWQPLTIGTQVWMLKNLNVDHYRNGDSIPEVKDSIQWNYFREHMLFNDAWCYYVEFDSLWKFYGKLYNWSAVNDSRGLAPEGWHIPTDIEWTELENYFGGDSLAGGKLKEVGLSHWRYSNPDATNESGFSALPGGLRNDYAKYCYIGYTSCWWSYGNCNSFNAYYRSLEKDDYNFYGDWHRIWFGLSVRCVKNK